MIGFLTESGSRYYVDPQRHHISGGIFKNLDDAVLYRSLMCIVGSPAVIERATGEKIMTSKVVRYLTWKDV